MADIDLDAITEDHEQRWESSSDEAYGRPGFCSTCRTEWPCDVPTLVAEVRRLTAERDSLARWKAEALPVMAAFLDLAKRVVPGPALGRPWSAMLAEHVDRQAAALREAEAEVARLTGPHRCCPCCADDPVHDVEPNQHTIECTSCGYGAARAALREVGALAREYEARYDADSYDDTSPGLVAERLLSILARHSGGESDG